MRPRISEVLMAAGERPTGDWKAKLERESVVPVRWLKSSSFLYAAEQGGSAAARWRRVNRAVARMLGAADSSNSLVWAHNLSLGHNFPLARAIEAQARTHGIRLLLHHHDFWFDQRVNRWAELQASGAKASELAPIFYPDQASVGHILLSEASFRCFRPYFGRRCVWIPNPVARETVSPPPGRENPISPSEEPLWLMPTRVLRRKNIAEGLLLTRWLRPEAWLATTAGASSAQERDYARRLEAAAAAHGWRFRVGLLESEPLAGRNVDFLMGLAEAIVVTSIQEGFGFGMFEAVAARRPVLCRQLPRMAPDLNQMGLALPYAYAEIQVDVRLFDWPRERGRQRALFEKWTGSLPAGCRTAVETPTWWGAVRTVPFSRLTLTAQIEVLAQPLEKSWRLCATFNPQLRGWRRLAQSRALEAAALPNQAKLSLSRRSFAGKFAKFACRPGAASPVISEAPQRAQTVLMEQAGRAENLFPLLWGDDR
ncbi:MAG: hypothetical protein ACR2OZ_14030 [Verrucomicrobiales bacterium]